MFFRHARPTAEIADGRKASGYDDAHPEHGVQLHHTTYNGKLALSGVLFCDNTGLLHPSTDAGVPGHWKLRIVGGPFTGEAYRVHYSLTLNQGTLISVERAHAAPLATEVKHEH